MEQITKDCSDLTAIVNKNDIPCTDVDMNKMRDKVNSLQDLMPIRIASIERADKEQDLFSEQPPTNEDNTLLWDPQQEI